MALNVLSWRMECDKGCSSKKVVRATANLEQQLLSDLRDRQDRLEEEFHSSRKRTEEMLQQLVHLPPITAHSIHSNKQ